LFKGPVAEVSAYSGARTWMIHHPCFPSDGDPLEKGTHAFVIRIWDEAAGDRSESRTLRGYIDHVETGNRMHVTNLTDIIEFIEQQIATVSLETHPPADDQPQHL
jgi:hypothetical protein